MVKTAFFCIFLLSIHLQAAEKNAGADRTAVMPAGKAASVITPKKHGDIYITASLESATVLLDSVKMSGCTPLMLEKVAAGKHVITVRKGDASGEQPIDLKPDDILKVNVTITKSTSSLKIYSQPAEAKVFVDNIEQGTTPLKLDNLTTGEHMVRLTKPGYAAQEQKVMVGAQSNERLDFVLAGLAYLNIIARPEDARIIINGQQAGRGKLENYELPAGRVSFSIQADNYVTYTDTIDLPAGETKNVKGTLLYQYGRLHVESYPPGAFVFLNGTRKGSTMYVNEELEPGPYSLKISKPTFQEIMMNITLKRDTSMAFIFNLEHSQAYWDSLRADRERDLARLNLVARYTMGALAVVSGGAALYMDMQAGNKIKEQEDVRLKYRDAVYGADFDKYRRDYNNAGEAADEYIQKRNTWGWVAGVSGALCGITFIF